LEIKSPIVNSSYVLPYILQSITNMTRQEFVCRSYVAVLCDDMIKISQQAYGLKKTEEDDDDEEIGQAAVSVNELSVT